MTNVENKKLAIYYGWPSSVNATFTVTGAINVFKDYNLLVLGAGLEDITHPDHINTVAIIAGLTSTKVYGYVDATLPIATISTKIDNWAAMAVAGIFVDQFGYDFGLTRTAQNAIVDYIHGKNLSAFVNAWNPDDAFEPTVDLVTHLGSRDWFLAESYQIINDNYELVEDWIARSEKLKKYNAATGTKIAGITTTLSGIYDQNKFDYAYFSALLYGFNAFGYGEQNFSSITAQLPFRPRKKYYGNTYVSDIKNQNGKLSINTNIGFEINTITRTALNTLSD